MKAESVFWDSADSFQEGTSAPTYFGGELYYRTLKINFHSKPLGIEMGGASGQKKEKKNQSGKQMKTVKKQTMGIRKRKKGGM